MAMWTQLIRMLFMNSVQAGTFMPEQGTAIAKQVDNLYGFLLVVSFVSCAILIGGMIYFAIKYKRRSQNDKTPYITHDIRLEILWSVVPLIIFLLVFAWGWVVYHEMREMPKNALEIQVTGKQWAWTVEYKNGVRSTEVVVPVNRDVKLILASEDVIHSFYVPSFRIKQDAVPGRYTALWFNAEKLGEFHVFCTEYCGTSHSGMITKLKVVTQEEFDKWLTEESEIGVLPIAQRGAKYFKLRCASCHYSDKPEVLVGPSLFQKFGTEETFEDGSKAVVDENYIRESMMYPQAKIVKGFPTSKAIMTSFQGQLSESEVTAIIEYIKGLK